MFRAYGLVTALAVVTTGMPALKAASITSLSPVEEPAIVVITLQPLSMKARICAICCGTSPLLSDSSKLTASPLAMAPSTRRFSSLVMLTRHGLPI